MIREVRGVGRVLRNEERIVVLFANYYCSDYTYQGGDGQGI
jgi:hypothetical protein